MLCFAKTLNIKSLLKQLHDKYLYNVWNVYYFRMIVQTCFDDDDDDGEGLSTLSKPKSGCLSWLLGT